MVMTRVVLAESAREWEGTNFIGRANPGSFRVALCY